MRGHWLMRVSVCIYRQRWSTLLDVCVSVFIFQHMKEGVGGCLFTAYGLESVVVRYLAEVDCKDTAMLLR